LERAFRWLWLGQVLSNLGTQCSLYGIGLWSFARQGQVVDFAAVAFVVQLSKVVVLPLLGRVLLRCPQRTVMLFANGVGAACTVALALQLLWWQQVQLVALLPFLALAAMAEAALVLSFGSLIPVLVSDPQRRAGANGLFVTADGLVMSAAPFAGSALVAAAGLAGVLVVDGASFLIALLCVWTAWTPQLDARLPWRAAQPSRLRFHQLWGHPSVRPLLVITAVMAFVYAATEVIFPAWVIAGPGRDRLGWALLAGVSGFLLGQQLWQRWAWRRPSLALVSSLVVQSLILMGAGLVGFQNRLAFWYGGLMVFSLALPLALSALQTRWQQLAAAALLPQVLAQRYRIEWASRLLAFAGVAMLVDVVLRSALAWPHWPRWLITALGQGPGRPLAVALGAMGWLLFLGCCSQWQRFLRESPSTASAPAWIAADWLR